jgi:hypothetical protein
MAINSSFTLSLVSGDGVSGTSNLTKQVTGLSYPNASIQSFAFPQVIGVAAPSAPAPTTRLAVPTGVSATASAGGSLAAGTYYYRVTALNAVGETIGSPECSVTLTGINNAVALSWASVTGATGYRVYRGTSSFGEGLYYATATNSYTDIGDSATLTGPPGSNTTQLAAPGTVTPTGSGSGGSLAAATYYYKVVALNAVGQTTASPECNVTTTGSTSSVALSWTAVAGATSYRIYRGTATGGESVYYTSATNSYTDTGSASTAGTPPGSNTTQLATPGTVTPTGQVGGNLSAGTYYYVITALNAAGETTASSEVNATVTGTTSAILLAWTAVAGAASYRVYRGTSASGENVYYNLSTNAYTDIGNVNVAGTAPTSNTSGGTGSVAAGVYRVKVTYANAPQGESLASTESATLTVLSSGTIVVPSPAAAGSATGYNVYITAANGASGTETKQNTSPISIGATYTQTAAVTAGAAQPGTNTTLTYTPGLQVLPAQVVYLRNKAAAGSNQVVSIAWTPQGGTSASVLDLQPQAALCFLEPAAGVNQGGISALTITVNAVQTPVETFFAG